MDNKYYGKKEDFALVREDRSAIYVSYRKEDVDDVYCTWYELCYYKKQHPELTIDEVKNDMLVDINTHTDERILSGFVWSDKPVWLSTENQFNYKAAYDLALQTKGKSLPVKFKLGEDGEGNPVYHTFETLAEFSDFYTSAIAYIQGCLEDGWRVKDSLDWSAYKDALEVFFPSVEPQPQVEA